VFAKNFGKLPAWHQGLGDAFILLTKQLNKTSHNSLYD
jgi:hypothetical protein